MKRKRAQRMPYRRLLLPIDGSPQSAKGVRAAMALARALGARVTALYVAPKRDLDVGVLREAQLLIEHAEQQYRARAKQALEAVHAAAAAAGVSCGAAAATGSQPWRSIMSVARKRRCDLIVLAAPASSGIGGRLFGGLAARLINRSRTTLLIVR